MLAPPAGKRPNRRRQASLLLAGKHLVNGTLRHAGMRVLAGMAQTFLCDPAIEAVQCPGSGPGPEQPVAQRPDLPLDASLLPARSRRAELRLDQVMRTHLQELGIDLALAAAQDRLHRRRHVVVNPPLALAVKSRKRTVMGVKHHLLALPGIAADERHAAVAQNELRNLDRHRHAANQHLLVAPVKLVGLTRLERQRNMRTGKAATMAMFPVPHMPANRLVARLATEIAKMLPDLLRVQLVTAPALAVALKKRLKLADMVTKLRTGLNQRPPLVDMLPRTAAQNLAHRIARYPEILRNRTDRLTLDKPPVPDLRNLAQRQHLHVPRSLKKQWRDL